jgi:alpha-beta hydrolase superfamily lysophospholipase
VYALDLRGRGRSDGERFYVEKFADYVSDVATVIALAKTREPGLSVYLLGHSAGGAVSCIYTLKHTPVPDVAYLTRGGSGPAGAVRPPAAG